MSFGGADNPFGGVELQPQGSSEPELPPRPLEEIGAERAAELEAVQAEHGEAISQEARFAEIGEAVLTLATDGGEGEAHLGEYIEHDTFPDAINHCLYQAECRRRERNPEYDITEESPRTIAGFLANGLHQSERAEERAEAEAEEIEETEAAAETNRAHLDWFHNECGGDFATAARNADSMPVGEPPQPELVAQRERLAQFGSILSIADRVSPADRELVTQRMQSLDLSQGVPNPTQFIQTVIFSSPDFDSGFSQEFQTAVATEFNLTPTRPAQPRNASEMQTTLREGRGTREITEIRRVEEPPGSGNWVEQAVVIGEEVVPFDEVEPLVLSAANPRVVAYPDPPGSETYRFVGEVEGTGSVSMRRLIPESGALPAASINNDMNEMLLDTVFRNNNLGGGLQGMLGLSDGTLGVTTDIDSNAPGRVDVTQGFLSMCLGENTTLNNRFLTDSELTAIQHEMRHLVPDGDLGAFNRIDATTATNMMQALFGDDTEQITDNMNRARPFINTGAAEQPSYQRLYALMYPDDAAAGYPRLRDRIGVDGLALLNMSPPGLFS